VQTMGRSKEVDGVVRALRDEAGRAHDVPPLIVERASSATLRKFEGGRCVPPGRVRAYFWAVVRRTALGSLDGACGLRARYLAAALADDLLRAGHPRERVRDEVALDRIGCGGQTSLLTGT
jgi:hypothetical protein